MQTAGLVPPGMTGDQLSQLVREVLSFTLSYCKTKEAKSILRKAALIFNAQDDFQWLTESYRCVSTQTNLLGETYTDPEEEKPVHSVLCGDGRGSVWSASAARNTEESSKNDMTISVPGQNVSARVKSTQTEEVLLLDSYTQMTIKKTDRMVQTCDIHYQWKEPTLPDISEGGISVANAQGVAEDAEKSPDTYLEKPLTTSDSVRDILHVEGPAAEDGISKSSGVNIRTSEKKEEPTLNRADSHVTAGTTKCSKFPVEKCKVREEAKESILSTTAENVQHRILVIQDYVKTTSRQKNITDSIPCVSDIDPAIETNSTESRAPRSKLRSYTTQEMFGSITSFNTQAELGSGEKGKTNSQGVRRSSSQSTGMNDRINESEFPASGRSFSQLSTLTKPVKHKTSFTASSKIGSVCRKIKHGGDKPFKRGFCHSEFSRKRNLGYHTRMHTGDKLYQCHFCNRAFTWKTSRDRHINVHTGDKPFICGMCGKAFSQKVHLSRHMTVHTGDKPFKCDICGKAFSRKSHLHDHMRVHTGEKPFKCDICGKAFSHRSVRSTHLRRHTGEKPFKCSTCNCAFSLRYQLVCHTRRHEDNVP